MLSWKIRGSLFDSWLGGERSNRSLTLTATATVSVAEAAPATSLFLLATKYFAACC